MDRRGAAGCLLALAACFAFATSAPTASNQTALDLYDGAPDGCYYNFQHYGEGDRIMTNEPCLNCTCHNRMLMCYLRVCPFTKPIGQDCTIEKRADQCCPIVTCPDVPVDLLTSTTNSPAEYGATGLGKLDKYGCSINNKYFPEGAKVPSTPNKPCEHCYCIRNMTTCVMQECTLHVDGCTPIYHKDVCCPVRYSCDHPEGETPQLDDMSTTVRPTPGFLLTTTTLSPVTQISQDCVYDNRVFPDGALIKTEKACDHCYCMKGDIVCVVQECGTPMENEGKNCSALPPREGVCCPDTYICEGDEPTTGSYDDSEITTNLPQETLTTLSPPRRTGSEGSGYRNEDTTPYTENPIKEEVEGSGDEEGLTDSTQPSDNLGSTYETEEPHEYISVTTKQPLVEQPEITTKVYIKPEATTDKLQDQELGSGEEEKDQDIPEISPATTDSKAQEETTVPYIHDLIETKATEEPESHVVSSTIISTIMPQEDITKHKTQEDESETTEKPISKETTVTAVDQATVSFTSAPIVEDIDRKSTPSEQSTSITDMYEPQDSAKPEDYSPSSTAAPGVEEEISTEIQEEVTERSEKPEKESQPRPTVTASTPMLEEIEKDTTEYSGKEPTSSEIIIPTVASEFSTSRPSDEVHKKVTEITQMIDEDISDYITTISPTFDTNYITTPESEEPAHFDGQTPIDVTPIADVIDKETAPSEKPTELFEDKIDDYIPITTSASKIDEGLSSTTEPNKELNTIPGVEEHTNEPSELEKTTISDSDDDIPLVNRYNDSPNEPTSVTLTSSDGSTAKPTTELIKEVEDTSAEKITTLSDEYDKSTLSPTMDAHIQTESPLIEQTPKSDEITLKPIYESTSHSDDAQTDQINLATTSSYDKLSETTIANIDENEIFNEPRIPGEGDCLLNGVTYRNESSVPSANKCLSDCKCISSIVKCDPIICSPPPEYMENCRTMYDPTDSCCPTYICDHKTETMPPQPHSQMSGTESPAVQCHGDECKVFGDDKQTEKLPEPCASGNCPSETDANLGGDVSEAVTTTPIKPCKGDECKTVIDGTSPDLQSQPCAGSDCNIPAQEHEIKKETCEGDGECKTQEEPVTVECEGDNCRRKDSPVIDQQIPTLCSGAECPQIDTSASAECKDENCRREHIPITDQHIPVQCSGTECQQTDIESPTSIVPEPSTSSPESQSIDSEKPEYNPDLPLIEKDSTSLPTASPKLPDVTSDKSDQEISTTERLDLSQESATTKRIDDEEPIRTTELPQEEVQRPEGTKDSDEIVTEASITKAESTTKTDEIIATEPSIFVTEGMTETSDDKTEPSRVDSLDKTTGIPDLGSEITTSAENIHIVKEPSSVTEIIPVEEEKKDQTEAQSEETYTKPPEVLVEDMTATPVVQDETSELDKSSVSTDSEGVITVSTESNKLDDERLTSDTDELKLKEPLTTEATKITDLSAESTLSPLDETTREKITVEAEGGTESPKLSDSKPEVSTISSQVTDEEIDTVTSNIENVTPTRIDDVSESGELEHASESGQDIQSATEENKYTTKSQQELSYSTTPIVVSKDETTLALDKEPQEGFSDSESTTVKSPGDKEPQDEKVSSDLDATTIKLDESTFDRSGDVTTPSSVEKYSPVAEENIPPSTETDKPSTIIEPSEEETTDLPNLINNEPVKTTPSEIASHKPDIEDIVVPATEAYDLDSKVTLASDDTVTKSQEETGTKKTELEHDETEITRSPGAVDEDVTAVTESFDNEPEKEVTTVSDEIRKTGGTITVPSKTDDTPAVTSTYDEINKETTKIVEDKSQETTSPSSIDKTTELEEDIGTLVPTETTNEPQKPHEIESSSEKDNEKPTTELTQTFESESEKVPSSSESGEEVNTKPSIEEIVEPAQTTEIDTQKEITSPVLDTSTEPTIKTSEQDNIGGTEVQDLVTEKVTVSTDIERKPEEQPAEPSVYDISTTTKPQEIITIIPDEQFEVTTKPTEIKQFSDSYETDITQETTPKNVLITSETDSDVTSTPESSKDESPVQDSEKLDDELQKSTTPSEVEKESDVPVTTPSKTDDIVPDKIPLSPQDIETVTDVKVELITETSKPQDITPSAVTISEVGEDATPMTPTETDAPKIQEIEDNKDITTVTQTDEDESKATEATYTVHDTEKITETESSSQSPELSSELPQESQTDAPLEKDTDKIEDISPSEISTRSPDIPYTETISLSSDPIEPVDKTTKSPESEISQDTTITHVEVTEMPSEDTSKQVTESDITESSTKGVDEMFEPESSATSPKPELISETAEAKPTESASVTPQKEPVTTGDKLEQPDDEMPTEKQPDVVKPSTVKPEVTTTLTEEYPTTSRNVEDASATVPVEEASVLPDTILEATPEVPSVPVSVSIDLDKTITTEEPISVQTEKVTDLSEKPLREPSQDTTVPEEDHMLSTTKATPTKAEDEIPTDKQPEEKPMEPEATPTPEQPKPIPSDVQPTDELPPPEEDAQFPPSGPNGYGGDQDYMEEDQTFGPGTCRYGGKVYVSAQQIPRDDPCDFCFCFRSDIICLQQSCPPPIHGCHEEPIQGFCCPRYECPVSMATTVNVTTTTTTTTTTLPPHFPIHSYKGSAQRKGCLIKGQSYKVGDVVRSSSGPCLHCTCGGDGQMKCDPKACTPEPMLRQMIAAAVSAKRRR